MQGLLYGVRGERWTPPEGANQLMVGLSKVPMRLQELDRPTPLRDDWAVAKTRLTGICGSDALMVFSDFGNDFNDSPLTGYFSFPTVPGHEVVADVVEVGPAVTTLEVGQRVVLNPWLSCGPRGRRPPVPRVPGGDLSLCWSFDRGPIAAGIHTGTSRDAPGGFAEYLPAHESMLIPVPEGVSDEVAVISDPFAVSLHSVTRHPPPPGGKVLVYGGGALGSCATAIVRALYPESRSWWSPAGPPRRRWPAGSVPRSSNPSRRATARGGGHVVRRRAQQVRRRHAPHGASRRVRRRLRHRRHGADGEIGVRLLKPRGTMVKSGVHAPERWEWSPLYFKEISWVAPTPSGSKRSTGCACTALRSTCAWPPRAGST